MVTVKSIKVFGDSKEYPADEVTMKKFVKWAMETKADLRAHPMLNEQLRVLDQCITTEAMTVLWACTALQQAGVPRAYPSEAVKSAVTQANLRARCDFHITWLTDIVAACAPITNAHIIKEIEKVKFGEGATGGITGRFYQEEDVTRYMGNRALLGQSITLKEKQQKFSTRDHSRAREQRVSRKRQREDDADGDERSQRSFKKRRFSKQRRFVKRDDRNDKSWRGKRERSVKREPSSNKNVECFNCGEKGHYANECPKPKKNSTKGGGRGGDKGGRGGRGGGRDSKPKSGADESNIKA